MRKHYDSNYLENAFNLAKDVKEKSYEYFKDIEEGLIVDLGCGTGKDAIQLAKKKNCSLLGIDHDSEMIRLAQENVKKSGLDNVNFEVGHAESIPLPDKSIAGLRSERVFQHLLDQRKALKEIHRCLISQGTLVIVETDWMNLTIYNEFPELIGRLQHFLVSQKVNNGFSSRHLFADIEQCGFKMVQVKVHPLIVKTLERANQYFKVEQIVNEMTTLGLFSEEEKLKLNQSFFKQNKRNYFNLTINALTFHAVKK